MRKVLLLLIFVALTSGCLHGSSGSVATGSFGLFIKDFSPDLSDLEEGDRFSMILEVENNGGAPAVATHALLHGISVGNSDDSFQLSGDQLVSLGTIDAPDEALDLPGGSEFIEWRLVAPDVPSGITLDYNPRVRVMYGYETHASTTVVAVSEDEYTRLRREGESLPQQKQTIVSKGPLGVTVTTVQDPAVIRENDDDVDLVIEVNRLGKGTIFHPDNSGYTVDGEIESDDLHVVGVTITASGAISDEGRCDSLDDETFETMIRGDSLRLNCEIRTGDFVGVKEIPISVDLRYSYLLDETASISVTGR